MAKLFQYLQFPFVRYALIVGVLIALCSSLLGVTLVLKRFSFIGDGLSHVAFGAMAVASVMGFTNEMFLALPVTALSAVLLLKGGQIMNIWPSSNNVSGDVCSTLFGSTSILTLSLWEVWLCIILSLITVVLFVLFYNRIFAVTFDENFTKATGTDADKYNLMIALIIAVIIVLAMNLVGSLLISALIIFPALSAMRLYKSFLSVTVCSAVLSVICTLIGIAAAILFGTPVGSTIVAADVIAFGICWLLSTVKGGSIKERQVKGLVTLHPFQERRDCPVYPLVLTIHIL